MTSCSTTYDLLVAGYQLWWLPALGLSGAIGAGAIYTLFSSPLRGTVPPVARKAMAGAVVFCLLWTAATFPLTYAEYLDLRHKYQRGAYSEISGRVEDFIDSGPNLQPGTERFVVGGVPFSYSQFVYSPGFRKTRASGGPLRNGILVRIRYVDNFIVRLEICDS
jgi:hypothetical protein